MACTDSPSALSFSRRDFVYGSLAAGAFSAAMPALGLAADAKPAAPGRKLKVGQIGLGGRGSWIANLFKQHGGYEFVAVADYFPEVADAVGNTLGVEKNRRFSGLSGYKKLLESGIEAVILETPPYFFPEHAKAAVAAGMHVYMAKPVAADVPGCLTIQAAGLAAGKNHRCFLVDYQMPTDPINKEVWQRVRDGAVGKLAYLQTLGYCGGFADPPLTANLESRLRNLTWVNDIAIGCDYIGNFDIHAIDAALWIAGQRPIAASGSSQICRANPHGDARDVCSVVYDFADGLVLNHAGQGLGNNADGALVCQIYGTTANAQVNYWGKAFVRGGTKHFGGGGVQDLYESGAKRNIASFYECVTQNKFDNPTVQRSVDGCLTCILGREAAARHTRLTMDELLKENKRLEVDLRGLRV